MVKSGNVHEITDKNGQMRTAMNWGKAYDLLQWTRTNTFRLNYTQMIIGINILRRTASHLFCW
jgi:hypothetical protein